MRPSDGSFPLPKAGFPAPAGLSGLDPFRRRANAASACSFSPAAVVPIPYQHFSVVFGHPEVYMLNFTRFLGESSVLFGENRWPWEFIEPGKPGIALDCSTKSTKKDTYDNFPLLFRPPAKKKETAYF